MEMTKLKLVDMCDIIPGYAFKSSDFGKGDNYAVKITDIQPPAIDIPNLDKVLSTPKDARTLLHEGDFVMAMTGATIGKVGKFEGNKKNVYINQRVCKFIPKEGTDKSFLFYLVSQSNFRKFIFANVDSSSAQPNIGHPTMYRYEQDVPNYETQKKIAAVLSALDDKIALNKKMNQKLEAMAKRLYDYWFVQYDFPNENGRPYKTSGGPMTHNETLNREIPEGWEVKTLASFAEYAKTTAKFDKAFNYVSTDNMLAEKQGLSGEILKPASGNVLCYENEDILISNIRPYFKKIWFADHDGTCSTDVLCIHSLHEKNSQFIYRTLWQDDFFDYVMQGTKGSKMPRGDKTRIMNYPICVAKENFDELVKKFSDLITPMQKIIHKNYKEISRLTALRDKLLPLLMNGQVTVGKKV